jgi:sortase (surface protein transpeptidase)
MPYGTYRYAVTGHRIISEGHWAAFRPRLDRERLLLATCWPRFTSLQRYVVEARPLP